MNSRISTVSGSVLRYPGGKTRAIKILDPFVPSGTTELCAPFVGGASFELHCAQNKKIHVYAYDSFEALINFWNYLKTTPQSLVKRIREFHPLSKSDFYHLRDTVLKSPNNLDRAAAFFAVNRSSFSGTTCSGGYSAESAEKRFTLSSIDKLLKIDLSNIEFVCADFEDAIARHPHTLLFLDPPYALEDGKSKLYGHSGNLHENFDHQRLFRVLQQHPKWILCYNNSPIIRKIYDGTNYRIHDDVKWSYGMSADKSSKEIVITRF